VSHPNTPRLTDRSTGAEVYPDDELEAQIGDGLTDLEAIVAALRDGPLGDGLPLVAAARRYTRHAVGGPLWRAMEAARTAGIIRQIPDGEARDRCLETNGWPLCEDVR